jgi:hypothetical protein
LPQPIGVMTEILSLAEKELIAVGKALPFSVFSDDRKLLLAEGNVVESDNTRAVLIKNGKFRSGNKPRAAANSADDVLERLRKDYGVAQTAQRFVVTMAPTETHEAYTAWVLGIHDRCMILTAPVKPDGAFVAVTPGQTWLCRTFQVTSAFRFRATVLKVAFEPFPHLHLELPKQVEKRKVRGRPRANVYLRGELALDVNAPCAIVDLSVGGGRIAVPGTVQLQKDQEVVLKTQIELMEFKFDLNLKCSIAGAFGPSDSRHPDVLFYGLKFDSLNELDSLVLHGFVNGQLAVELNSLWQVLAAAPATNGMQAG